MTEQDWIDLGRRAVACEGWRWMPGMLTDLGERVMEPGIFYLGTFPDFRDDATKGCLFKLVRERWQAAHTRKSSLGVGQPWACGCDDGSEWTSFEGPTEAAVLVDALEAAND